MRKMNQDDLREEFLSMADECLHYMTTEGIPLAIHRQKLIEMHARCVKLQKENPWLPEVPDIACETRN